LDVNRDAGNEHFASYSLSPFVTIENVAIAGLTFMACCVSDVFDLGMTGRASKSMLYVRDIDSHIIQKLDD
jgi:hypothetical protein